MARVLDQLGLLAPALAFLLLAVPLADLLGRLGLFDAVADRLAPRVVGTWPWWALACATTVVLNLDTTVVLLTPLLVGIARRRGQDPLVLAVVPLLAADLASSLLPVSNLTNLVAAERLALGPLDLVVGLGPATVAMVAMGVLGHRRWAAGVAGERIAATTAGAPGPGAPGRTVGGGGIASGVGGDGGGSTVGSIGPVGATTGRPGAAEPSGPEPMPPEPSPAGDGAATTAPAGRRAPLDPVAARRALRLGGALVAALLVAFVAGPAVGVAPWEAVLVADLVLVAALHRVPWRSVPVATAAGVAVVAAAIALVVPPSALAGVVDGTGAVGAATAALGAAGLAATVDNLPALLALLPGVPGPEAALPVLLGVNAGALLSPVGALANLLWLATVRREGVALGWGRALRLGVALGGPALLAGVATLALQRAVLG